MYLNKFQFEEKSSPAEGGASNGLILCVSFGWGGAALLEDPQYIEAVGVKDESNYDYEAGHGGVF